MSAVVVLGLVSVPGLSQAHQRYENELPSLFFGNLVPLGLKHGSKIVLPVVCGLEPALPVALLAFVATGGTQALSGTPKMRERSRSGQGESPASSSSRLGSTSP